MKLKSFISLCLLGLLLFLIVPLTSSAPPPDFDQSVFEQNPPTAHHYWVQKIDYCPEGGGNMIMRIQYSSDMVLPEEITLYGSDTVTFHDDGADPDISAGDLIYSAYITENISEFREKMIAYENILTTRGSVTKWSGHGGEEITDIPHFDVDGFDNYEEVEIDALLINAADCASALLKQNSLFITELSVVEDPARTYNIVTRQGTKMGVWTFGYLMKSMANTASTGVSADSFLKSLINKWITDQTVNGQLVPRRLDVIKHMIEPWLRRANNNHALSIDSSNWEAYWHNTDKDSLLVNAPFRLMAIVNRIDLRGNPAYGSLNNAGETRFIFTLVAADTITVTGGTVLPGEVPKHFNQDFILADEGRGFIDWEGMNIILEYGNVQNNLCNIRNFAQRWLDLSYYTSFGSDFNDSLEAITRTVIDAGVQPLKPNGSAINRIRTNEKIFQVFDNNGISSSQAWKDIDWELRQFEINPSTHLLHETPVTNTPVSATNFARNLTASAYPSANLGMGNRLIDWVFNPANKQKVSSEKHLLPLTYPGPADYLTAAVARIDAETPHYTDLNWYDPVTTYPLTYYDPNSLPLDINNQIHAEQEKLLRRNISINTCQGCHSGENKTIFTHVRPQGYGKTAIYWGAAPDTQQRRIDTRTPGGFVFSPYNTGQNNIDNPSNNEWNYLLPSGKRYYVNVSPFITGRNYSGTIGSGTWQDDWNNNTTDPDDDTTTGLFYVYDPSNDVGAVNYNFFFEPQKRWGYNDLERRKADLCLLLNSSCAMDAATIIALTSKQPFPFGAE